MVNLASCFGLQSYPPLYFGYGPWYGGGDHSISPADLTHEATFLRRPGHSCRHHSRPAVRHIAQLASFLDSADPGMTVGRADAAPAGRLVLRELEPAKSDGLCLQDDGAKCSDGCRVQEPRGCVYITIDGKEKSRDHRRQTQYIRLGVQAINRQRSKFLVVSCYRWLSWIADTITVAPAEAEKNRAYSSWVVALPIGRHNR